ncbi:MAG: hypothetical protein KAJ05_01535, partial [Candidatus Latescibacteria bacterium]|nr:hypothetical protein [Candidatus Latescibacterota bacterium]
VDGSSWFGITKSRTNPRRKKEIPVCSSYHAKYTTLHLKSQSQNPRGKFTKKKSRLPHGKRLDLEKRNVIVPK